MKSSMAMAVDTPWGNVVTLTVESELDNAHEMTMAEIARKQVLTLSVMVAEVRRENERELAVREHPDTSTPPEHERRRVA